MGFFCGGKMFIVLVLKELGLGTKFKQNLYEFIRD